MSRPDDERVADILEAAADIAVVVDRGKDAPDVASTAQMCAWDHRCVGPVADLLEKAARATPAAVEVRRGGWWVRHTDTATSWSAAVLAHGPTDRLVERVEAAERFYAAHGAPPRFQICGDCPDRLDGVLAERGYRGTHRSSS